MKVFKINEIGIEREKKVMEIILNDKTSTLVFTQAACLVLEREFGVKYACYGGTPVMPIAELRPFIK